MWGTTPLGAKGEHFHLAPANSDVATCAECSIKVFALPVLTSEIEYVLCGQYDLLFEDQVASVLQLDLSNHQRP